MLVVNLATNQYFLKKLVEEYKTKDFEFLRMETWSNNMEGLKRYRQKNGFNIKNLMIGRYIILKWVIKLLK